MAGSLISAVALILLTSPLLLAQGNRPLGSYWLRSHGLDEYDWLLDHDRDGFPARSE